MKKRILSTLLISAILVGMTGCNTAKSKPVTTTVATTTTTTAATTTTVTTTTTIETESVPNETDDEVQRLIDLIGNNTSTTTTKPTETTEIATVTTRVVHDADYLVSLISSNIAKDTTPEKSVETTVNPATTTTAAEQTWENPANKKCNDDSHYSVVFFGGTVCPVCNKTLVPSTTETPVEKNKDKDYKTFEEYYNSGELKPGTFVETTEDGTTATYTLIYNSDYDIVLPEKIVHDYANGTNIVTEGIWNTEGQFANGTITTTYTNGFTEVVRWRFGSKNGEQWYMSNGDLIYEFTDGTTLLYSGNWTPEGFMYNGILRIENPDGSYSVYDGTWKNGEPDNGTYKIFDSNQNLQCRGKVKNGRFGSDWELIVGSYMQFVGEAIEDEEPIWSIALEKIGEVVSNHEALNSFE